MSWCRSRAGRTIEKNEIDEQLLEFIPPEHKGYQILEKPDMPIKNECEIVYKEIEFKTDLDLGVEYKWLEKKCFKIYNQKKKHQEIILLYIKNKNSKFGTLIYSHQTNETLGDIYPTLLDMSSMLKYDIISYDYSGYGYSTKFSSKSPNPLINLKDVLYFTFNILKFELNRMILVGHSTGAELTIELAAANKSVQFLGIVLISPILRMIYKNSIHETITKITHVNIPIFLVHGIKDEEVPIENSKELTKLIQNLYMWFPKKGNHTNIFSELRYKFFKKFKFFLDFLSKTNIKKNERKYSENSKKQNLGEEPTKLNSDKDGPEFKVVPDNFYEEENLSDFINTSNISGEGNFMVMYSSYAEGDDENFSQNPNDSINNDK